METTGPDPSILAAIVLAGGVLSGVATGVVLGVLRRRAILDHPNERSSHTVPTPRGGGWGLLIGLVPAWIALALLSGGGAGPASLLPVAGVILLAAVSWVDDRRGLPARVRFAAQVLAAGATMIALPDGATVTGGALPPWFDRTLCLVAWVWFMNLYNFMDGIDGIAGAEAAAVGTGLALVVATAALPPAWGWQGLAVAAAAVGFLVWNWHPARLFMGDVGSVPLGFLLGWLLLNLAVSGQWAAALLLPMVFVADATLTLVRRAVRREKVWQAHREHAYQRAVRQGRRHDAVVIRLTALNAALLALALASTAGPAAAVGTLALGIVATLLVLRMLGGPAAWRRDR